MGGSPERQPPTPAPDHHGPTMVYMHGVPLPLAALNGWFAEQSAPVEVTVICDEAGGAARAERRAERRAEIEFNKTSAFSRRHRLAVAQAQKPWYEEALEEIAVVRPDDDVHWIRLADETPYEQTLKRAAVSRSLG